MPMYTINLLFKYFLTDNFCILSLCLIVNGVLMYYEKERSIVQEIKTRSRVPYTSYTNCKYLVIIINNYRKQLLFNRIILII